MGSSALAAHIWFRCPDSQLRSLQSTKPQQRARSWQGWALSVGQLPLRETPAVHNQGGWARDIGCCGRGTSSRQCNDSYCSLPALSGVTGREPRPKACRSRHRCKAEKGRGTGGATVDEPADQSTHTEDGASSSPPGEAHMGAALLEELGSSVVAAAGTVVEVAAEVQAVVEEAPPLAGSSKGQKGALVTVAFWVACAVAFGTGLAITQGSGKASEFFAGYLLEQSLSVDNLFVFVLIFQYFQVPLEYQPRVLSYGIGGAVVFRAIMIGLGVATIQRFGFVNLAFASILLLSSYKLLQEGDEDEEDLSQNFIVKTCQRFIPVSASYDGDRFFTQVEGVKQATPLLLTLAVVELSDIAFAVDSIPAVFGVTQDPLVVYSSNIFAIVALRSLYTLISGVMGELRYLQPAVALVLGFIGSKMIADFAGFHVSTELSLGVVASILGGGVLLSLKNPMDEKEDDK